MTNPIECSACHHGTVPTYTRSASFGFDDGLGPTTDAPCLRCSGTGSEPCAICADAAATEIVAALPVCADCAPFARERALGVADTVPAPADDSSAWVASAGVR